ncbi:MAG: nuclear transport factor 2 family protein [Cyanobacteriota bacterium]
MFNLPKEDVEAIKPIHQKWIEAEKQGRSLDVLQYCTDDVRWMVPNSEVLIGKETARSLLDDEEIEIVNISTEGVEIRGSSEVAYKTSRYTTQFRMKGIDTIQVSSGTHLWILHKQENRQWQVALVTWQLVA